MDDAAHLLTMLSHAYGAPSMSTNVYSSVGKSPSPNRVSASHRNTFEHLLTATRNVGHELVSVLASKLVLERVLEQLACGLIVVTADLKVMSLNGSARELVDNASGLTIIKRRLACMDGRSQNKFEHVIQRLSAKGGASSAAIRVTRGNDHPDLQLNIAAFGAIAPLPITPDVPAFCIWAFDPSANRKIDAALLREIHGLTAAEATVTEALFRGLSIDEAAVEFGVTINTIKTHLKHVFQKCEVRSQAELLQMLALGPR